MSVQAPFARMGSGNGGMSVSSMKGVDWPPTAPPRRTPSRRSSLTAESVAESFPPEVPQRRPSQSALPVQRPLNLPPAPVAPSPTRNLPPLPIGRGRNSLPPPSAAVSHSGKRASSVVVKLMPPRRTSSLPSRQPAATASTFMANSARSSTAVKDDFSSSLSVKHIGGAASPAVSNGASGPCVAAASSSSSAHAILGADGESLWDARPPPSSCAPFCWKDDLHHHFGKKTEESGPADTAAPIAKSPTVVRCWSELGHRGSHITPGTDGIAEEWVGSVTPTLEAPPDVSATQAHQNCRSLLAPLQENFHAKPSPRRFSTYSSSNSNTISHGDVALLEADSVPVGGESRRRRHSTDPHRRNSNYDSTAHPSANGRPLHASTSSPKKIPCSDSADLDGSPSTNESSSSSSPVASSPISAQHSAASMRAAASQGAPSTASSPTNHRLAAVVAPSSPTLTTTPSGSLPQDTATAATSLISASNPQLSSGSLNGEHAPMRKSRDGHRSSVDSNGFSPKPQIPLTPRTRQPQPEAKAERRPVVKVQPQFAPKPESKSRQPPETEKPRLPAAKVDTVGLPPPSPPARPSIPSNGARTSPQTNPAKREPREGQTRRYPSMRTARGESASCPPHVRSRAPSDSPREKGGDYRFPGARRLDEADESISFSSKVLLAAGAVTVAITAYVVVRALVGTGETGHCTISAAPTSVDGLRIASSAAAASSKAVQIAPKGLIDKVAQREFAVKQLDMIRGGIIANMRSLSFNGEGL